MALPYVTPNQVKPLEEKVNKKQDTLVSGVNIKTINNQSILGSGNINVSGGDSDADIINPGFYFELEQFRQILTAVGNDGSEIQLNSLQDWKDLLDTIVSGQYLLINILCVNQYHYSELVQIDYTYHSAQEETDEDGISLTLYTQYGNFYIYISVSTDEETEEDVVDYDIDWFNFFKPCNSFLEFTYQDTSDVSLDGLWNLYDIAIEEDLSDIQLNTGVAYIEDYGEDVPPITEFISEINFWLEDSEYGFVGHYNFLTSKGPIVVTLEPDAETGDTVAVVDWTYFAPPSGGSTYTVAGATLDLSSYYEDAGGEEDWPEKYQYRVSPDLRYTRGDALGTSDEFYEALDEIFTAVRENGASYPEKIKIHYNHTMRTIIDGQSHSDDLQGTLTFKLENVWTDDFGNMYQANYSALLQNIGPIYLYISSYPDPQEDPDPQHPILYTLVITIPVITSYGSVVLPTDRYQE